MVRIVFIGSVGNKRLKFLKEIDDCIIDIIHIGNYSINFLPKDVIDLFIIECYELEKSKIVCGDIKNNYLLNHIPLICLTNNIDDDIKYCDIIISDNTSDKEYIYQVNTLIKMKLMDDELKKEKIILELKVQERTIELEEKAEKLKITLNSIGDGVIVTDQNGHITSMNPVAMELTELVKVDYYRKHIDKILNIRINNNKINIFQIVEESKKTYNIEDGAILYSKKGKEIRISDSASPIFNKKGDFIGIVIVFSDITDEYEMRYEIMESEKKYRRIFSNVPDIIYTMTIDGVFTSINNTNILGYSISEIIGSNIRKYLYSDEDFQKMSNSIRIKLENNQKVTEYNLNVISKNGLNVPMEIRSQLIFDDNGRAVEIFGIARDISERLETQKIIQENEERYKNILENMDSGVGVFKTSNGHDFYFIDFNTSAKDMEKKKDDDAIGREIYDVFPEFKKNNFKEYLENVWINEKPVTVDNFYYESENGDVKGWRRFFIYKLKKSNEIVVIGDDITDIKEYQDELKKSKEKAENSDKLKSIFLANMSHEIRTPLNAIIGFSSQINEKTTPKNLNDYVKIIHSSGNLLLTLIDDILDLSKIEVGDLKIDYDYFSLNEMFIESKQEYISLSKTKNKGHIKINIDIPKNDIIIYNDSKRLKQVINNLVGNSLKFTDKGHIKYGFNVNKDIINFYVEDTGIGISEENQDKIFDRFVQIQNKSQKKQEGTGLGLTICKAIIEMLGGNIRLESTLDKGTTFYFSIPYIKCNKKNNIVKKQPDKIKLYNWVEKKMVVIDDNDINFKLTDIIMKHSKIDIIRCINGIDFKNKYDIIKPDVIIMNLHLQDCHACDLIKYIRNIDDKIPIVVVTAYTDKIDEKITMDCGANFFMNKPINWNMLKEKINDLISKNN